MFRRIANLCSLGLVLLLAIAVLATAAFARTPKHNPSCTIIPDPAEPGAYVMRVSGLPTATALNVWITDPDGNIAGAPLGTTPDGTFNFKLNGSSSPPGATYTFSGRVKKNTAIYASCSLSR